MNESQGSNELITLDPSQIIDDTLRDRATDQVAHPWRDFLNERLSPSWFASRKVMWVGFAVTILGAVTVVLAPEAAGFIGLTLLMGVFLGALFILCGLAAGILSPQMKRGFADNDPLQARQLAYAVLDEAPEPRLVTGREGNGVFMNRSYPGFFNVSERAPVTLEQIFAGEDRVLSVLYRLQRAALGGGRYSEEAYISGSALDVLRDRNMGSRWLRFTVRPIDRRATYFVWEVSDVTDSRAVSEVENAKGALSSNVLDLAPCGLLALSATGHIQLTNKFASTFLDYEERELEKGGMTFDDLLMPEGQTDQVFAQLDSDKSVTLELRKKSGEPTLVSLRSGAPADGEEQNTRVILFSENEPLKEETTPESPDAGGPAGKKSEGDSKLSADVLPDFFDAAPIGIAVVSQDGKLRRANAAFAAITRADILPGDPFSRSVDKDDREDVAHQIEQALSSDEVIPPIEVRLAGDANRAGQLYVNRILEPSDGQPSVILFLIETTDQKLLELQFAQSQKMQAVGQLAGGVAHDFNNVLTAIIGYCDLLLTHHKVGDPSFADINHIRQNANRAANLVRQLLAFSRKQTLVPNVLLLTDAIAETATLLDRLLGEKIKLVTKHQRDQGYVKVDQGQLEQVIVNLAVNARDAMKDGGTLTIRTYNVSSEESQKLGHTLMRPAEYVCLEIGDTGCGMAKEDLGKIFEPFFTTKGVGEGTGLGLSTVYGIIKQTGGFIFPESDLGEGTTFRIYLPRHSDEEAKKQRADENTDLGDLTGVGTVLLVEDEDAVRAFATRALTSRGYRVHEAANGELALDVVAELNGEIDVLVTDVIMPNMDGPTMAKKVREQYPDIKVIFISGYTEDAFKNDLDRPEDFVFLPKPFSLKQLAAKVKEVMNG